MTNGSSSSIVAEVVVESDRLPVRGEPDQAAQPPEIVAVNGERDDVLVLLEVLVPRPSQMLIVYSPGVRIGGSWHRTR